MSQSRTYPLRTAKTGDGPHELEIRCPMCDYGQYEGHPNTGYVHLQEPQFHDTDGYTCPTGERGSWIDIPMWCEGGHHFNLVIAFHKGCSYIHVVEGYSCKTEPLAPLVNVRQQATEDLPELVF